MKTPVVMLFLSLCLLASSGVLKGAPVGPLDLKSLLSQADLVVVGRAIGIKREGPATTYVWGTAVEGHWMIGHIDIQDVIRGSPPYGRAILRFFMPEVAIPYARIADNQFGVFFLRRDAEGYEVVDPYHPFVNAQPGATPPSGSYEDQVVSQLIHVLRSPAALDDERFEAVRSLCDIPTQLATAGLRIAASQSALKSQVWALAGLVRRNDVVLLDSAEQLMLRDPRVDDNLRLALASGLEFGVRDRKAIPALTELLHAPDANIRRGAASALRNTRDPGAAKPLLSALEDSDGEVRYYAVSGLGEITGQDSWTPSIPEFQRNEQKYLDHWHEWAQKQ